MRSSWLAMEEETRRLALVDGKRAQRPQPPRQAPMRLRSVLAGLGAWISRRVNAA
jgi:hypothetical protein